MVGRNGSNKSGNVMWDCICVCGGKTTVASSSLRKNYTKSCGCLQRETIGMVARKVLTKHGMKGTRLYSIWRNMKTRCENPNSNRYKHYGARGITYCVEWGMFEPFMEWALENGYDDDLTLDRKNNDMGYSPDNCRWANWITQENNRGNNTVLEIGNECHTLQEWSRISGIGFSTIQVRLKLGWQGESLIKPVKRNKKGGSKNGSSTATDHISPIEHI